MSVDNYKISDPILAECAKDAIFITSASYESRCLTMSQLIGCRHKQAEVFWVKNLCPLIGRNLKEVRKFLGYDRVHDVATEISKPTESASAIDQAVRQLLSKKGDHKILIDVTTFTHEHLLFILKSLYDCRSQICELKCVYSGAKEYSYAEEGEKKWLSKGCAEIRSVIGYPGALYPREDNVLIIVVGLEHERAGYVVDDMSPDKLYLGFGKPDIITDKAHEVPRSQFEKMLAENIAIYQNVERFAFNACDPLDALEKLKTVLSRTPNCNHIIVPMNTKLSTLAVAALGLHNPAVQLCYAQPETYNFNAYSKAGNEVHMVDCTEFILGR